MTDIKTADERFEESLKFSVKYQGGPEGIDAIKLRIARDTLPEDEKHNFLNLGGPDRDTYYQQVTGNPLDTLARHEKKKLEAAKPKPIELPEALPAASIITDPARMLPEHAGPGIQAPKDAAALNLDTPAEETPAAEAESVAGELRDDAYAAKQRDKKKQADDEQEQQAVNDKKVDEFTETGAKMLKTLQHIFGPSAEIPAALCNAITGIEISKDPELGKIATLKFEGDRNIVVGNGFIGKRKDEKLDYVDAKNIIMTSVAAGWAKDASGQPRALNLTGTEEQKNLLWVAASVMGVMTDYAPPEGSNAYDMLKKAREMEKDQPKEAVKQETEAKTDVPKAEEPPGVVATEELKEEKKEPVAAQQPAAPAEPVAQKESTILPKLAEILKNDLQLLKNVGEILDKDSDVALGYWKSVTMQEYLSAGKMDLETQEDIASKVTSIGGLKMHFEDKAIPAKELEEMSQERLKIEIARAKDAEIFNAIKEKGGLEVSNPRTNSITHLLDEAIEKEVSETGVTALQNLKAVYAAGIVEIGLNDQVRLKNGLQEGGALAAHDVVHEKMETAKTTFERQTAGNEPTRKRQLTSTLG